ncbi:unnamed protein product [Moneuplotes crassus]|uniref:Uncharacterized protein n=1 Tax=Euplotes crassus TaxID=5936 RepID=A0AAD1X4D9_EUPCR|nr:unnamed protein product [Moneuplotes crassus]
MEKYSTSHFSDLDEGFNPDKCSKGLMTNLPLASKILPYYGYADQCKVLMTKLRRDSREIWLENEQIFLQAYPGKGCLMKYILKKRVLTVTNVFLKSLTKKGSEAFHGFIQREEYKLYQIIFHVRLFSKGMLQKFLEMLSKLDLESLTVKSIMFKNFGVFKSKGSLPKTIKTFKRIIAKFNKELINYQDNGRDCYLAPSFITFSDQKARNSIVGRLGIFLGTSFVCMPDTDDVAFQKQFSEEIIDVKILTKLLRYITFDQICQKSQRSSFSLKMSHCSSMKICHYLQIISEGVEAIQNTSDSEFPLRYLKLIIGGSNSLSEEDSQSYIIENIYELSSICQKKKVRLVLNNQSYSDTTNTLTGESCQIKFCGKELQFKKFRCKISAKLVVSEDYCSSELYFSQISGEIIASKVLYQMGPSEDPPEKCDVSFPIASITHVRASLQDLNFQIIKTFQAKIFVEIDLSSDILLNKQSLRKLSKFCEKPHASLTVKLFDFKSEEEEQRYEDCMASLHRFDIVEIKIIDETTQANKAFYNNFEYLLEEHSNLRILDLEYKHTSDDTIKHLHNLFTILKKMHNLESLRIDICDTCEDSIEQLVKSIARDKIDASFIIRVGSQEYSDRYRLLSKHL